MPQTMIRMTRSRHKMNPKRWNGQIDRDSGGDFYGVSVRHKERGLDIVFRSTNCAPEQFRAYINGLQVMLTEPSILGTMLVSIPGPQGVIDELKRMYRKDLHRRTEAIAYGYRLKDNPKRCAFVDLYGDKDNLQSRLSIYKEAKRQFCKAGWKTKIGDTARLGQDYKVESVKKIFEEYDAASPVIVHILYTSDLYYPEQDATKRRGRNL